MKRFLLTIALLSISTHAFAEADCVITEKNGVMEAVCGKSKPINNPKTEIEQKGKKLLRTPDRSYTERKEAVAALLILDNSTTDGERRAKLNFLKNKISIYSGLASDLSPEDLILVSKLRIAQYSYERLTIDMLKYLLKQGNKNIDEYIDDAHKAKDDAINYYKSTWL